MPKCMSEKEKIEALKEQSTVKSRMLPAAGIMIQERENDFAFNRIQQYDTVLIDQGTGYNIAFCEDVVIDLEVPTGAGTYKLNEIYRKTELSEGLKAWMATDLPEVQIHQNQ